MPETNAPKIYQLKVTLKDVEPPVWRRFQMRSDDTLYDLHGILQIVMGWEGEHLYSFNIGRKEYMNPFYIEDEGVGDVCETSLRDVLRNIGTKAVYLYDFGDGWEHTVVLEKILEPDPGAKYPVCLTGKRSCPPEDCGGPWGYEDKLRVLSDPEDEEHEDIVEWMGENFDPEKFDCEAVNQRLA